MRCAVTLALVACSGGGSSSSPDASPDTPAAKVVALSSCPSAVDASIVDSANAFIPKMVTVPRTAVVKISTTAEHFVIPNAGTTSDPVLMVGRNESKCFRFDASGTYGIACGVHGFAATITVQ